MAADLRTGAMPCDLARRKGAMPGPPPDPNAVRRNKRAPGAELPPAGRQGDPPPVPKGIDLWPAGVEIWRELWSLPQAVEWERMHAHRVVARYCSMSDSDEPDLAELRQLEDRLGLNPKAMRALMWTIGVPESAEVAAQTAKSSRERRLERTRRGVRAVDPASA